MVKHRYNVSLTRTNGQYINSVWKFVLFYRWCHHCAFIQVIKQTVMTSVYGVTFVGACKQIHSVLAGKIITGTGVSTTVSKCQCFFGDLHYVHRHPSSARYYCLTSRLYLQTLLTLFLWFLMFYDESKQQTPQLCDSIFVRSRLLFIQGVSGKGWNYKGLLFVRNFGELAGLVLVLYYHFL